MKKVLSALVLGMALSTGFMAEAGSIPTNMVPLQTYAIKRVNCYLSPNGQQKGWIDPGDYVIVQKIQNGWAYGSYPVGNKRISRWFKANDLVYNVGFANQQRYSPKQNTYTYKDPNRKGIFGSFNDNEPLTVVSDYGEQRQFIYKVSGGGYKMAWVPYWDCWSAEQAGKQERKVDNSTTNSVTYWEARKGKTVANINSGYYQKPGNPKSRGQCTWYAFGRAWEVTGKKLTFSRSTNLHAKYWGNLVTNASVDHTPTSKCIGVRTTRGGGYGHVIFIEYVGGGWIYYTDCNTDGNGRYDAGRDAIVKRESVNGSFIREYSYFIHP